MLPVPKLWSFRYYLPRAQGHPRHLETTTTIQQDLHPRSRAAKVIFVEVSVAYRHVEKSAHVCPLGLSDAHLCVTTMMTMDERHSTEKGKQAYLTRLLERLKAETPAYQWDDTDPPFHSVCAPHGIMISHERTPS